MSDDNTDSENEEYVYEFEALTPEHKKIDMKFYFNINCGEMPVSHINATYSLLHRIMKDKTLEDETREVLIKVLLDFDYGNREIREQLQNAVSSFNQNRESRPMYENENMENSL